MLRMVYERMGVPGLLLYGVRFAARRAGQALLGAGDWCAAAAARLSWTAEMRRELARNRRWKNKYAGRRCFILANGPSLRSQDIRPLAGEITIGINSLWRHPGARGWSPTCYTLLDPDLFDGSGPTQGFLRDIHAHAPDSEFFVPLFGRKVILEKGLLPQSQTHYLGLTVRRRGGVRPPFDLTGGLDGFVNVVHQAIVIAMYMGCSPIYLLGVDHDFLARRVEFGHFYDGPTIANHQGACSDFDSLGYRWWMEMTLEMWLGYEHLQRAARAAGIRILNATPGSFLDVFEPADYGEVVRGLEGASSVPAEAPGPVRAGA